MRTSNKRVRGSFGIGLRSVRDCPPYPRAIPSRRAQTRSTINPVPRYDHQHCDHQGYDHKGCDHQRYDHQNDFHQHQNNHPNPVNMFQTNNEHSQPLDPDTLRPPAALTSKQSMPWHHFDIDSHLSAVKPPLPHHRQCCHQAPYCHHAPRHHCQCCHTPLSSATHSQLERSPQRPCARGTGYRYPPPSPSATSTPNQNIEPNTYRTKQYRTYR